MKAYIGTKRIHAEPCQRDGIDGYKVEYENGYLSWSPKDVFEKTYRPFHGELTFGEALEWLKLGNSVTRSVWASSGLFIYLNNDVLCFGFKEEGQQEKPQLFIPTADDLFATDYTIVV